jgi:hypothetical protein
VGIAHQGSEVDRASPPVTRRREARSRGTIGEEQAPFDTFSIGLDPGLNDIVLPVPPGTLRFGCFAAPFEAGAVDEQLLRSIRSIAVSDPHAYWAPPSLACADPRFWTVSELLDFPGSSYVSGGDTQAGESLEQVASRELPWLRSTDDVVAAMYPESKGDRVRPRDA